MIQFPESDKDLRLYLLNMYLEAFRTTLFRQTMFAEFEEIAHKGFENGETLTAEWLSGQYAELNKLYFGEAVEQDELISYEWARIPHFYRPFYVYKYATGYTSAVALSEAVRSGGPQAVSRYLEFLSMGGSADPLDELRHAGVDLASPAPVHAALQKFERVLAQAQELAAEI